MDTMASQITSLTIVYLTIYSAQIPKTSKLRVTGLCAGNSPVTYEFPAQMASNAENVSIWWRHHVVAIASIFKFMRDNGICHFKCFMILSKGWRYKI